MTNLLQKKCKPCERGVEPLEGEALEKLMKDLQGDWKIVNQHHLEKEFAFKDFKEALEFTNKIGALAETEGHHPDIHLCWGKVRIILWTHKINGLSDNDFILAAKIDKLH
jgi:4a-hydroxytetrahydrobiopterin dehydratase